MSVKTFNIAVILAGIDEEYQHNIAKGINDYAKKHNCNVSYFVALGGVLRNSSYDKGEYNIFELVNYDLFDGVIYLNNTINSDAVNDIAANIKAANIPAIVFDNDKDSYFYDIKIDNFKAMEDVVRHIVEHHKAKRINYVSGPLSNPESARRYSSYLKVLEENNIEIVQERVFIGEFRASDGRLAAEKFIKSNLEFPDAIICANDAMALALIGVLSKNGIKVPQDVIVTGFDNITMASNFSPELTTVQRPLFEAGYRACEMLKQISKGETVDKTEVLFTTPIFTESCGCKSNNKEFDIKSFRRTNYELIESYKYYTSILNRMTSELADSNEIEAVMNLIGEFSYEISCDSFYICLCDNWHGEIDNAEPSSLSEILGTEKGTKGYTWTVTPEICQKNGEIYKLGEFNSKDMFPEELEGGGHICYFSPIHFREYCLGYSILVDSDFPISSQLFHTWNMGISNAIENIRKLDHLNSTLEKLDNLYVIDNLCKIYNRNGFIRETAPIFEQSVALSKDVMIMFIDMDGLKAINDNYGHKEGDFALKTIAKALKESCTNNEICARFGGDEFLIFATDYTYEKADELSLIIRNKFAELNKNIDKPYSIDASMGCYITTAKNNQPLFNIITKADEKMYEEKKRRKTSKYLRRT